MEVEVRLKFRWDEMGLERGEQAAAGEREAAHVLDRSVREVLAFERQTRGADAGRKRRAHQRARRHAPKVDAVLEVIAQIHAIKRRP